MRCREAVISTLGQSSRHDSNWPATWNCRVKKHSVNLAFRMVSLAVNVGVARERTSVVITGDFPDKCANFAL